MLKECNSFDVFKWKYRFIIGHVSKYALSNINALSAFYWDIYVDFEFFMFALYFKYFVQKLT